MKVILVGLGRVGCKTLVHLIAREVDIIGVYDDTPKKIGQDAGTLAGIQPIGIKVKSLKDIDDANVGGSTKVKIALHMLSYGSELSHQVVRQCLHMGMNVISLDHRLEQLLADDQELQRSLNDLAVERNVTLYFSGYNEVIWSKISRSLGEVVDIFIETKYNCEDFLESSVDEHLSVLMEQRYGVGLTKKEYRDRCVADDVTFDLEPCPAVTTLPAILANKLNWQIASSSTFTLPVHNRDDVYCEIATTSISAGRVTGNARVQEIMSELGQRITVRVTGKVFARNEVNHLEIRVRGRQPIIVKETPKNMADILAESAVQRIEDVVSFRSGHITCYDMQFLT